MKTPTTLPQTYSILTSPGPAAIAVIRLRGGGAVETFLRENIAPTGSRAVREWTTGDVSRAGLRDASGEIIDDIVVSVHAAGPAWDVRLHLHGSPWLVRQCGTCLESRGFKRFDETETTLWPTRTRIEAEALARMPAMPTLRGVEWLGRQVQQLHTQLDRLIQSPGGADAAACCRALAARLCGFTWLSRPLRVAVIGPPNAGKSTLVNALADREVSLVSPQPGTTRDWVEVPAEIDGMPVVWLDTAGIREPGETIEAESIRRTRAELRNADVGVVLLDATSAGDASVTSFLDALAADLHAAGLPAIVAWNKTDITPAPATYALPKVLADGGPALLIAAARPEGLDDLEHAVLDCAGYDLAMLALPAAFTRRQAELLTTAAGVEPDRRRMLLETCLGIGVAQNQHDIIDR